MNKTLGWGGERSELIVHSCVPVATLGTGTLTLATPADIAFVQQKIESIELLVYSRYMYLLSPVSSARVQLGSLRSCGSFELHFALPPPLPSTSYLQVNTIPLHSIPPPTPTPTPPTPLALPSKDTLYDEI